MPHSSNSLIEHLRQRIADRARATDGRLSAQSTCKPVTEKALQQAERKIGFPLPALLRSIYLQVGNGGFGPDYGLIGIRGGALLDGCTLETCYQNLLQSDSQNPAWQWPTQLLPIGNAGCGMWSCLDCTSAKLPLFLWDPNNLDPNLTGTDAHLSWGSAFWNQRQTFQSWLTGWLNDRPAPEPQRPSQTWLKSRAGVKP